MPEEGSVPTAQSCDQQLPFYFCLPGKPTFLSMCRFSNEADYRELQSLKLAWLPRADGIFLTDAPQKLVQQGKVANIPFITGTIHAAQFFFFVCSPSYDLL